MLHGRYRVRPPPLLRRAAFKAVHRLCQPCARTPECRESERERGRDREGERRMPDTLGRPRNLHRLNPCTLNPQPPGVTGERTRGGRGRSLGIARRWRPTVVERISGIWHMAHIRQSRPAYGLGFRLETSTSLKMFPVRLEAVKPGSRHGPRWCDAGGEGGVDSEPRGLTCTRPGFDEDEMRHERQLRVCQVNQAFQESLPRASTCTAKVGARVGSARGREP